MNGVSHNIGIGTQAPGSLLSVAGGMAVGSNVAYTTLAAPTDGLMIQGNVGIGTTEASGKLMIRGVGTAGAAIIRHRTPQG